MCEKTMVELLGGNETGKIIISGNKTYFLVLQPILSNITDS